MASKKTYISIKLQVEGMHNWSEAHICEPKSSFLSHPHRHVFHIKAKKAVTHKDRDVEFIKLKRDMLDFIAASNGKYKYDYRMIDFGGKSCEMIAEELFDEFSLIDCEVMEDGENGGGVYEE